MRSKIWILLLCIQAFAFTALAQNPAKRQLVLQLANGGYVAFRSEMPVNGNSLASLLYAQALAGENRIIHRVLTDAQQNVVFGYDLWISADPITKKFSVAVLPADEAFRRTFLKGTFATFPKSTTPQTLDDGDAVSLELLVNRESGAKIVDVVSVTFDRTRLRENHVEAAPKDFTLEAVALGVKNYSLLLNGNEVSKSKSSIGCTGALLWLYIPGRGRFIFSLVPREGYDFVKFAVLDENRIAFTIDDEHYEWVSSDSILPSGGTWNLWVLHDPNYTPLFGAEDSEPRPAPKPRSVFDKIEDVLAKQGAQLTINGRPIKSANNRSMAVGQQRVMVGGADNMDNLLPKSPPH